MSSSYGRSGGHASRTRLDPFQTGLGSAAGTARRRQGTAGASDGESNPRVAQRLNAVAQRQADDRPARTAAQRLAGHAVRYAVSTPLARRVGLRRGQIVRETMTRSATLVHSIRCNRSIRLRRYGWRAQLHHKRPRVSSLLVRALDVISFSGCLKHCGRPRVGRQDHRPRLKTSASPGDVRTAGAGAGTFGKGHLP